MISTHSISLTPPHWLILAQPHPSSFFSLTTTFPYIEYHCHATNISTRHWYLPIPFSFFESTYPSVFTCFSLCQFNLFLCHTFGNLFCINSKYSSQIFNVHHSFQHYLLSHQRCLYLFSFSHFQIPAHVYRNRNLTLTSD